MTLIVAPAGYGKTTLVARWLDEVAVPWAWYSIDEQDNSISTFVSYLNAALISAYPGCGNLLDAALQSPLPSPPGRLADYFVADLEALPGELIMVLDDYHALTDSAIHAFLSRIIQAMPAGVHFLLLSRMDPPLKVPRLRASHHLMELRAAQLRFTQEEANMFLENFIGRQATSETVSMFLERTEGWAVGLQLAAISLRDGLDIDALAHQFAQGRNAKIAEYLISEVLDMLPAQELTDLLYASVFQRFCAPLLDAVIQVEGRANAGNLLLENMRARNLFLTALDDEGIWYRFHPLFVETLQHRLRLVADADAIARVHAEGSQWFEANALIEEAILHALEAGEDDRAGSLVEGTIDSLLNLENWRVLEQRLDLLPARIGASPGLIAARGWVEQFRFRPSAVLALAQEAEDLLAKTGHRYSEAETLLLHGSICALRAVGYHFTGDFGRSLENAEQALTMVSPHGIYVRGICELCFARAKSFLGPHNQAVAQLDVWLRQQSGPPDARTFRLLLALAGVHYDALELGPLQSTVTLYHDLSRQAQRWVSYAWAGFMLGWIHYQRGDIKSAELFFADIVDQPFVAHTRTAIDAWTGLCLSLRAQGRHEEARHQALALRRHLISGGQVELVRYADALVQYLNLSNGQPVSIDSSYIRDIGVQLGLDLWLIPVSVWILAQTRIGLPQQLSEVSATLATCRALLPPYPSARRSVEFDLLETLLHVILGDRDTALAALRRAIIAAEPGGALRVFVDAGPELLPLFHELADMGCAPAYIKRILAEMPAGEHLANGPMDAVASPQPGNDILLDPEGLSNRELDVLILLERRLSNKEIAALLFISPRTVKKHTISIYQKLQVNSRRGAVAQAKALGPVEQFVTIVSVREWSISTPFGSYSINVCVVILRVCMH